MFMVFGVLHLLLAAESVDIYGEANWVHISEDMKRQKTQDL
jgi:hypothetical protein